ncbi:hypothetical protein [Hoeflea sp.]|uniref:hypothetical protein n=1 Tax=Hoeflea sp. TaxID=1940281 RepID=UPI003A95CB89
MSSLVSSPVLPLVAAACLMLAATSADAAVSDSFDCSGRGITITLTLEPETGTATLVSPGGTEELSAEGGGIWRDDTQRLQFFSDETPPVIWMGPEKFTCKETRAGN